MGHYRLNDTSTCHYFAFEGEPVPAIQIAIVRNPPVATEPIPTKQETSQLETEYSRGRCLQHRGSVRINGFHKSLGHGGLRFES